MTARSVMRRDLHPLVPPFGNQFCVVRQTAEKSLSEPSNLMVNTGHGHLGWTVAALR